MVSVEMIVAQLQTENKAYSGRAFTPVPSGILQRKCSSCGNHTVVGEECAECAKKKSMLQRKLMIGASNDPLEQEVDRVADQVMSMPLTSKINPTSPHIQRFSGQAAYESSETAPPSVDRVISSPGIPLEPSLRLDMEGRFGRDFSQVRVHTGSAAEQSARDVNAHAYTMGNNVVFGTQQYMPNSNDGRRLIAHELVHVVQQESVCCSNKVSLKRFKDKGVFVSSRYHLWDLTIDVRNAPTNEDDMNDFIWVYHGGIQKAIEVLEANGISPRPIRISMTFKARFNEEIVEQEAFDKVYNQFITRMKVKKEIPKPVEKNKEDFEEKTKEPVQKKDCPVTSVIIANTISEYIDLIACAEKISGLANRDFLSLIRQLYYGSNSWSRSRNSTWDVVIPCKVSFTKSPMETYDNNVFQSLQNSQIVDGNDIGHIFTGLEAMVCPQDVVIEKKKFGIGVTLPTGINNELFATWVGDIGSAVGRYIACWDMIGEADEGTRQKVCDISGANFRDLNYYFQKLASSADLEGDIAAFVIRAEQNGISCQKSLSNKVLINSSVSQVLHRYFIDAQATRSGKNSYHCFAESIGATIKNKGITNKAELTDKYSQQVSNFAQLTYANDVEKKGSRIPKGPIIEMININSSKALNNFWKWIESKLDF